MSADVNGFALSLGILALAMGCSEKPPSLSGQEAGAGAAIATPPTEIIIDGSSTVYPITEEMAQRYEFENTQSIPVSVSFSGTGGGFEKFCAGDIDINNASRPITQDEMANCKANGVEYIEIPVAFDALTVVVNGQNTWAQEISLDELKTLWEADAEGRITRWRHIRPDWPDEPINLYGPGQDSGTFDYFNEVVIGEAGTSRTDYTDSEDDYELVVKVQNDPNALGYFGYAYFKESEDTLKALGIDSGKGSVLPASDTIRQATYQPLARPLFIYVNAEKADNNPVLSTFVEYYLANARTVVDDIGYEPLPNEAYGLALAHFQQRQVGTVFGGKSQPGLTIEVLLEKEAAF